MTPQTWSGSKIEWIVHPLDAARMRGALAGDDEALCRAFGDVVHDTLHA